MLIDGEKWACEACVRGHRVSSCRHHDRPLIRINKKGRPFSVCCICRGPCKEREEHSKLNRDNKKSSDGESDSKSSGKKSAAARRRIRPSSFARIAPHPAPLPSSSEPFPTPTTTSSQAQQPSSPLDAPRSAAAAASAPTIPPTDPSLTPTAAPPAGAYVPNSTLPASQLNDSSMGYPYVTLPIMEEPILQPSSTSSSYPFSDDMMFNTSMSDGGFVPDSMYIGFEDVDALPEDWSTFLLE